MALPKCGAKKTNSDLTCQQPAGAGTDHLGVGRCKFHGGNTPTGKKNARRLEAEKILEEGRAMGPGFLGFEVNVTPEEALLGEVRRTAGHVRYISAKLDSADELKDPLFHAVLLDAYRKERAHLVTATAAAMRAGIEERQVRLAEQWGAELAKFLGAVLQELKLTKDQQARAPEIVGRHLKLLETA